MRRVRPILALLLHGSFDTTTEAGRDAQRERAALVTRITSVVEKGASMVVMLLSIRWTVTYLGSERFGVWMTIAGLAQVLTVMDFGLGNAMMNRVAQRRAEANPELLRQAISGGLGLLFLFGLLAAVVLCSLAWALPWNRIVRTASEAIAGEARGAGMVFALIASANLVSLGLRRVYMGLQRAYVVQVLATLGSVVSLALFALAAEQRWDVPELLLCGFGVAAVAPLLLLPDLARRGMFSVHHLASAMESEKSTLLKIGGAFVVLQIGALIISGSDSVVLAAARGAAEVGAFAIAQRLLYFVTVPLFIFNQPLWASYADAYHHGDWMFLGRTFRRSLLITASCALAGGGLVVLAGQSIAGVWTHHSVALDGYLLLAMACWAVVEASASAFAQYLNGCGYLKPQVVSTLLFACIALPAKYAGAAAYGPIGMVIATFCIYGAAQGWVYGVRYPHLIPAAIRGVRP